jgi:hypothetical protein
MIGSTLLLTNPVVTLRFQIYSLVRFFCLQVSRTLRRELEHFDVVMKEEFETAFGAYRASYWRSLQVQENAGSLPWTPMGVDTKTLFTG